MPSSFAHNKNIATATKHWPATLLSSEGGSCLPQGTCEEEYACSNRMSSAIFYIVFHSNYGSILLSFRDMIDHRTNNGRWTHNDRSMYIRPLRHASSKPYQYHIWLSFLVLHIHFTVSSNFTK